MLVKGIERYLREEKNVANDLFEKARVRRVKTAEKIKGELHGFHYFGLNYDGGVDSVYDIKLDNGVYSFQVDTYSIGGDLKNTLSSDVRFTFLPDHCSLERAIKKFPTKDQEVFSEYPLLSFDQENKVIYTARHRVSAIFGSWMDFSENLRIPATAIKSLGEVSVYTLETSTHLSQLDSLLLAAYEKGADLVFPKFDKMLDFEKGLAFRVDKKV
jgi:hypothetical protein